MKNLIIFVLLFVLNIGNTQVAMLTTGIQTCSASADRQSWESCAEDIMYRTVYLTDNELEIVSSDGESFTHTLSYVGSSGGWDLYTSSVENSDERWFINFSRENNLLDFYDIEVTKRVRIAVKNVRDIQRF